MELEEDTALVIRRASIEDLPEMMVIWNEGVLTQGYDPPDLTYATDVFRTRIESQTGAYGIWVGEIEGTVAGWQSLNPSRANPLHKWAESSTYVSKASKRRGIGRALLEFATRHAKSSGLSHIGGFIKTGNVAPIKIVESLGWRKVGITPRSTPDDMEFVYYVYAVPLE